MASSLVTESLDTSAVLKVLTAFRDGDFSARLPVDQTGVAGKIADTLNDIFKLNERMASEFARISSAVGKEGKINQRASLGSPPASGRSVSIRSMALSAIWCSLPRKLRA